MAALSSLMICKYLGKHVWAGQTWSFARSLGARASQEEVDSTFMPVLDFISLS